MARFAWDERSKTLPVPLAPPTRSETRLRVPAAHGVEMGANIARLTARIPLDERDVVPFLEAVVSATATVEERIEDIGAMPVTRAWLLACGEWLDAIATSLANAYEHPAPERRVALELVAEESSMRLLMRLERESLETVSMLRNLDGTAARAAQDLAAAIELADRMLHAIAERAA